MKPIKSKRTILALLAAGALGLSLDLRAGDPDSPDALRQRAAESQEQIRDLKAAGRHEEAMRLQRTVEERRQRAAELRETQVRQRPDDPRPEPRRERVQRLERLMVELEQHQRAGRQDEAAELKREIMRFRQEMATRPQPLPEPRIGELRRLPPEALHARPPYREQDREEFERRMHHVKVAIENLHAAGLHDMAGRLERELDQGRRRIAEAHPPASPMEQLSRELRELRGQLEEMRGNLHELQARMQEPRSGRR
jgi:hypothetical protein